MSCKQILETLYNNFISEFNNLKNLNLINEEALTKYHEYNVHSILQYCLIKASLSANFIPIPEYKIKLSQPLDKYEIDERFKDRAKDREKSIRYQHKITVDVALIKDSRVKGFCEIYTPDEIHGVLPSRELSGPWITPRHKLQYLVRYMNFDFCIVVNLFTALPSWPDAKKYSLDEWRKLWKEFVIELSKNVNVLHVMINSINDVDYAYYEKR